MALTYICAPFSIIGIGTSVPAEAADIAIAIPPASAAAARRMNIVVPSCDEGILVARDAVNNAVEGALEHSSSGLNRLVSQSSHVATDVRYAATKTGTSTDAIPRSTNS